MIELLEDAGAIDHPGSFVDEGGPGFSSACSLLYAENPSAVLDNARKGLRKILTLPGSCITFDKDKSTTSSERSSSQ